ncbi:MAG TPA: nucleotidyltransferase domain-containing protein [Candidatus Eubacterium faecipullorum]|uniref:Nucleotidyltransferase domain-containing protein n=1 Tax=Candidatus Eubacterium faecipullorum TaxID=2838571 RepID=A0A9D1UFD9_9FIRM|nr:nucleotidyltransferase domain-containing protein [Candidatus Eubacterium faecipullorum]
MKGVIFMLTRTDIENSIKELLARYNAEYALLFGSYARGEETDESDIDVLIFGGENFKKSNIFAFAEELRNITGKNVDAFEICEVDRSTPFYDNIIKEGIKIA